MSNESLRFTENHEYFLTSTDEVNSEKTTQAFSIDLNQPLDKVVDQCHTYLYGQRERDYRSIPELMKEIEGLLDFLKKEYRKQGSSTRQLSDPSLIGQALKVPLYTELIREICGSYKVSARRYLLRFLREHGNYVVADEHIQYAGQLDRRSLNRYTNCLIEIAKASAKERNQEYDEHITDLLELMMTDTQKIDRDMLLKAGYALGMDTEQVTDFGARVLGAEALPLTTAEGLIHRYCLDTFRNYDDAVQLLEAYKEQSSKVEAQPAPNPNQNAAHTRRIAEGYQALFHEGQSDEEFLEFLCRESHYLNGGSRTARKLYRVLAIYYKYLIEGTLSVPNTPKALQFVLLELWELIVTPENTLTDDAGKPKSNAYKTVEAEYHACLWNADACISILNGMNKYDSKENWCYLRDKEIQNTHTVERVVLGNRIYSNLLGDYHSLGENLPPEEQRILKEDLLILLYKIIRFAQPYDAVSAELSADLADVFWYTADHYLQALCYGFPNSAAFYMPNPLEYSLFLSIAGNLSMDSMQSELFYSSETRKALEENEAQLAEVWQERDKVEAAIDKFLADPDLKLKYSKQQQRGLEKAAGNARKYLKKVNALDQVRGIWCATEWAMSEIKEADTAERIKQIIKEAEETMKILKASDLGQIFRSRLKNLRQEFVKDFHAELTGLDPLIDALDQYFVNKRYVCCALFDDNGVWASFPDNQKNIDRDNCIFRWNEDVPDILNNDNADLYAAIQNGVLDMVERAEKHCGYTPPEREQTIRTTEIQVCFMLLYRQLQLKHPELNMKFEVYAKDVRKIKLSKSVNIEETQDQKNRKLIKKIQQAMQEPKEAPAHKTRK